MIMEKFVCKKGENDLNYIDVFVEKGGLTHKFNALLKTGSSHTIFSAKELNVEVSDLKSEKAIVGYEELDVYEVFVNSVAIGDEMRGSLSGLEHIYVSDLEMFDETAIIGADYLSKMNFAKKVNEPMVIEFDRWEIGSELTNLKREQYLKNLKREQYHINLTDFFFIEDGMYPTDFELVLVILDNGELTAGCVERGSRYTEDNPLGVIRQNRGGVIDFEHVIAWKSLDGIYLFDSSETE